VNFNADLLDSVGDDGLDFTALGATQAQINGVYVAGDAAAIAAKAINLVPTTQADVDHQGSYDVRLGGSYIGTISFGSGDPTTTMI
jgi:hypothetical protein